MHLATSTTFALGTALLALALSACVTGQTSTTQADLPPQKAPNFPANYKGTPYKGIAQEIPGRVELENFDEGGYDVGFKVEHHDNTSSGKNYRPGDKPNICITNSDKDPDKFDSAAGKRYPVDDPKINSYYIGYARPNDWVKCTVNVKKAGVYKVNTIAANDTDKMTFSLYFNDARKAEVTAKGSGNYHFWKVHDNICTVKLDAGLQVMKFQLNSEPHMNYDFLEFVYDEKASAANP